jgi:hypothetical protein
MTKKSTTLISSLTTQVGYKKAGLSELDIEDLKNEIPNKTTMKHIELIKEMRKLADAPVDTMVFFFHFYFTKLY